MVWVIGALAQAFGEPTGAARICADLGGLERLDLPRLAESEAARCLPVVRQDDWEFRWTQAAPPAHQFETRVVPLGPGHHRAISQILDEVLP